MFPESMAKLQPTVEGKKDCAPHFLKKSKIIKTSENILEMFEILLKFQYIFEHFQNNFRNVEIISEIFKK